MDAPGAVEQLWDNLLSRQLERVRKAYRSLDKDEQVAVLAHLRKMESEPGWHPEQRTSAITAQEVLDK